MTSRWANRLEDPSAVQSGAGVETLLISNYFWYGEMCHGITMFIEGVEAVADCSDSFS